MRITSILIAALLASELGYFFFVGTVVPVAGVVTVPDRELAAALGPARVAQISDLHISRTGMRERKLTSAIIRIDPDILVITGDLVARNEGIEPCCRLLGALARGRTVIAVLGNNDHPFNRFRLDTPSLVRQLEKAGVTVLINKSVKATVRPREGRPAGPLYIIGLDDSFSWRDNIFTAREGVPRNGSAILLAHSPNIVERIDTGGIGLILSGHTHGGQIVLPLAGAVYTNPPFRSRRKFVAGLYRVEGTYLYVNRGIGTVSIPLRLFARPEIAIFRFAPSG